MAWRALELSVKPPFNYELSLEATPPLPPFERLGSELRRCVWLRGEPIPIKLRVNGSVEEPSAELQVPSWLNDELAEEALRLASWMTCADLSLEEAYRDAERAGLRRLVEELRGLKPWLCPDPWEGLAASIVFQQVSLRAAYAMLTSFVQRLGRCVEVEGERFSAFPRPLDVVAAGLEALKACKLSEAKSTYISDIARLVVDGGLDLEGLHRQPTSQVLSELMRLKGVGEWTAELASLISYGRWEVVPAADLGLRKAMAKLLSLNRLLSVEEVRRLTEPWGRWRGLLSYYVLIAYERGLLS